MDADPWLAVTLGILSGAAVATKLTNLPIVIFVLAAVIWMHLRGKGKIGPVALLLGVAVVTSLPWFLKNLFAFGDPIFPFLSELGPDPWLESLGATSVPGISILAAARKPFDLLSWVLSPGDLTVEASGPNQGLPLLVALGWISALVWGKRERRLAVALVALATAHVAFIVLVQDATNLRYLQPALIPLTLASAIGLAAVATRSKLAERLVAAVVALSLVGSVAWMASEGIGNSLAMVSRVDDSTTWLESRETSQLVALDQFLVQEGADNVILLFEGRAAGFSTPVLQDNLDTSWQAMTTLDLSECPDLGGATHVVVNVGYLQYVAGRGVLLDEALWGEFDDFAGRCLSLRSTIGPYNVYET